MISYAYDANSNTTTLMPQGRPAHSFDYTPIDLTSRYSPPKPGVNHDANPVAITRSTATMPIASSGMSGVLMDKQSVLTTTAPGA